MAQDYLELVEYLDREFSSIRLDFSELRSDFREMQKGMDIYAARADKYFEEMTMLNSQVNRHERWHHVVADKLDIKLDY